MSSNNFRPGRKILLGWGIKARAAQEIAALSKSHGVDLDKSRAEILAGLVPSERETLAMSWPALAAPPAPVPRKTVSNSTRKQDAAPAANVAEFPKQKKPAGPVNPPAAPAPGVVHALPDRPQAHGGALKTGGPALPPPRPQHGPACDAEPLAFADEVRHVAAMAARARVDSVAARIEWDDDPCDETAAALVKAEQRYVSLTKTYGALTASLDAASQLGDTRSLSEVIRTLTEAASYIRADVESIVPALVAKAQNGGPKVASVAMEIKELAEAAVCEALEKLSLRMQRVSDAP